MLIDIMKDKVKTVLVDELDPFENLLKIHTETIIYQTLSKPEGFQKVVILHRNSIM